MKLLNGRIMIRPGIKERVSPGGIVIPETAVQTEETHGTVIGVAEDVTKVAEGDMVLYSPHVGVSLEFEGERIFVMFEKDIIGIISKE